MEYQLVKGHGLVYQERIATPCALGPTPEMSLARAEHYIRMARARQVKLMERAEHEMEERDGSS